MRRADITMCRVPFSASFEISLGDVPTKRLFDVEILNILDKNVMNADISCWPETAPVTGEPAIVAFDASTCCSE